jgi:hypothetical protein
MQRRAYRTRVHRHRRSGARRLAAVTPPDQVTMLTRRARPSSAILPANRGSDLALALASAALSVVTSSS